ncbi:heat-inducible transcriptional repressor HrcA [Alkalicoccus urumqiensis]|uniref:Heat-inducible transcription repressor HrcA n=1 Tax=Alkalicoccus urumqiensis TaxID=1548213 RepID=A0A2P6MFR4_ALKUR|nr:heat-inducible transcriptional repressor HrcA [Alkalicoccus urumqiensis]PRO65091.1 heat-inducible transcriptional repressor HrcA [Alkalicoccus urumqiensis]
MLTERQLAILKAIVDDYIVHAEPVGSRTISKRNDMAFSPATIRNEMSDLEELGFLEKPHSSAGRIPSQKGYRYYVDHLLSPSKLSSRDMADIHSRLALQFRESEQVIQQSAKVLSQLTSYTSIVLGPEVFESRLSQIQLIPISGDQAVMIIVTDSGHVENQTVHFPESVSAQDVERVVNILNDRLRGVPIYRLQQKLSQEIADVLKKYVTKYETMLHTIGQVFADQQQEKVYYGGKTNILSQPEFHDVDRVRSILNLFEEDALISRLIRSEDEGLTIRIGAENDFEPFSDLSIVTATYTLEGKYVGTIGLLGPTRMEYPRVISLMDYFAKDMTQMLSRRQSD